MLAWVETRSGILPAARLSVTGLVRSSIAQAKTEVQEKAEVKKAVETKELKDDTMGPPRSRTMMTKKTSLW